MIKRCPSCMRALPLESFGFVAAAKDFRRNWCKECDTYHKRKLRVARHNNPKWTSKFNELPIPRVDDQNHKVIQLALTSTPFYGYAYDTINRVQLQFKMLGSEDGMHFVLYDGSGKYVMEFGHFNLDLFTERLKALLKDSNIRLEESELSLKNSLTLIYYI